MNWDLNTAGNRWKRGGLLTVVQHSTVPAWQTENGRLFQMKASIRKCAVPGISGVRSKCINEQVSGETVRECTAEEDL